MCILLKRLPARFVSQYRFGGMVVSRAFFKAVDPIGRLIKRKSGPINIISIHLRTYGALLGSKFRQVNFSFSEICCIIISSLSQIDPYLNSVNS